MSHSYEEIRSLALDLLAGREQNPIPHGRIEQYASLYAAIRAVFERREHKNQANTGMDLGNSGSLADADTFLDVFWSLFREGIITLGCDSSNKEFPFFRVSPFGRRMLDGGNAYFFHDTDSYVKIIIEQIPDLDEVVLIYLKEAMQAFHAGCILSTSVMLGVASEHIFLGLLNVISRNPDEMERFSGIDKTWPILRKVNKFKNILEQNLQLLPREIREDLETNFAGILSIIRTFRNDSGHPSGKFISREQAYILLNLFIPYCKKLNQLTNYYTTPATNE